jgi:hypothetical protein
MKRIEIGRHPTINEALSVELTKEAEKEAALEKEWASRYDMDEYASDWRLWMQSYDEFDDDAYDYDCYGDEFDITDFDRETACKDIYFYDKIDCVSPDGIDDNQYTEKFNNIKELKDYCAENGINIPTSQLNAIDYRTCSHCTIDPSDELSNTLISDSSWGSLYWTCSDLMDEVKYSSHK